ncbi:hypothetical protein RRG08_029482 [Elysia crispata]|uniref:Uncharacterized protein n=1 Tax=Elysia crispata TaxID=231223 RepID=A0AAE1B517_9GAST|nr:hypothetical protein RRG08_029482 [Elysia crispata]
MLFTDRASARLRQLRFPLKRFSLRDVRGNEVNYTFYLQLVKQARKKITTRSAVLQYGQNQSSSWNKRQTLTVLNLKCVKVLTHQK